MRLFYVDDSGAPVTRTSVFGWVEVGMDAWYPALQQWLDWRSDLHRTIGIPEYYELHGTKFVAGRGRPTGTPWDTRKAERAAVVTAAFPQMSTIPGLRFGAVYACATATKDHRQLKARCYLELVRLLDDRLTRDRVHARGSDSNQGSRLELVQRLPVQRGYGASTTTVDGRRKS